MEFNTFDTFQYVHVNVDIGHSASRSGAPFGPALEPLREEVEVVCFGEGVEPDSGKACPCDPCIQVLSTGDMHLSCIFFFGQVHVQSLRAVIR